MALPTTNELLEAISITNSGVIADRYPYEYAHSFIMAYPETVPSQLIHPAAGQRLASPAREVSRVLHAWAVSCNVSAKDMAEVLADAYIARHFKS
ncbi:MAG: hypothetical protein H9W81_13900 [Enterococcus sp.]|nr:hypothetical protein [Enterococcus sp.]